MLYSVQCTRMAFEAILLQTNNEVICVAQNTTLCMDSTQQVVCLM